MVVPCYPYHHCTFYDKAFLLTVDPAHGSVFNKQKNTFTFTIIAIKEGNKSTTKNILVRIPPVPNPLKGKEKYIIIIFIKQICFLT